VLVQANEELESMNRLIAATALTLLGAMPVPAAAQLSLGFRTGLSYAHLAGDVNTDSRTRLAIGAFAGLRVVANVDLQAEVSYSQKGARTDSRVFDPVEGPIRIEQTTSLDYVELQVPLGLTIPVKDERVRPRVYVGPAAALVVNCKIETDVTPGSSPPPADCRDDTKSLDFGVVFGIGLEYGRGPGAFIADIRYDVGFTNISDIPDDPSKKNRSLQLLVGYVRHL
jgi:hypothetical protein